MSGPGKSPPRKATGPETPASVQSPDQNQQTEFAPDNRVAQPVLDEDLALMGPWKPKPSDYTMSCGCCGVNAVLGGRAIYAIRDDRARGLPLGWAEEYFDFCYQCATLLMRTNPDRERLRALLKAKGRAAAMLNLAVQAARGAA